MQAQTETFSVASFFAGCGGLDLGFQGGFHFKGESVPRTAFEIEQAFELDPLCEITYKQNIGNHFHRADLSQACVAGMVRADLLIGGFPCQDFSICGPRKGLGSERGRLYSSLVQYCAIHQPKMFVAENVANILTMHKGKVIERILGDFREAGYRVECWRLNAADYGVPQARYRVFIVGVRNDISGFPDKPLPQYADSHRSIEWAIGDLVGVHDESVPNQSQYFKANRAKNGHGQGDEISQAGKPDIR